MGAEADGEHLRLGVNPRAEYSKAGELEASLGIIRIKPTVVDPAYIDQPAEKHNHHHCVKYV